MSNLNLCQIPTPSETKNIHEKHVADIYRLITFNSRLLFDDMTTKL